MTNEWLATIIGASTVVSVLSTVAEWRLGRLRDRRLDLLEKRSAVARSESLEYVINVRVDGLDDVEALRSAIAAVTKEASRG